MKLRFSDPVVVAQGPDSRQAKWGPYQFPGISKLDNGALLYTFSVGEDSERAYGQKHKGGCYVSYNDGKTWVPAESDMFAAQKGVRLPNGDRVYFLGAPSIPLENVTLPTPIGHTTLNNDIYYMKDVNPEYTNNGTWILRRINKEHPEGVDEPVTLNWPDMTIRSCLGVLVKPSPRGRLRIAPDGTLWMPHYYFAGFREDGSFVPYLCNYLLRSTDNGKTWDIKHTLNYEPDPDDTPRSAKYEGYGENDITFAPDGSMFRLIRTNSNAPSWFVRSEDGGETWSEPEIFDSLGVWPCLLTLGCGVTLASYGRPGVRVRATSDPSCKTWEDPIEIVAQPNPSAKLGNGTCSYTNMIALDDRTAALTYSDWTIKDANGVPHKCMMYRTVTVED